MLEGAGGTGQGASISVGAEALPGVWGFDGHLPGKSLGVLPDSLKVSPKPTAASWAGRGSGSEPGWERGVLGVSLAGRGLWE